MNSTVKCELEFSQRDLIALRTALFSAYRTQSDILHFYDDNSEEQVVTPREALEEERDCLCRLIHVFSSL